MKVSRVASLLVLLLAAAPAAEAQSAARARPRAVDLARGAQRAFESFRRSRSPVGPGGSGACEERVGRFCYWDNNGEGEPPPEPAAVGTRRRELLERLVAASTAAPEDDWVAGQRVRYLVEDGQLAEAAAAARACAGTRWWCRALLGFALHEASDHAGAAAAYDSALALMPERERCGWFDVSPWMADGAGDYERLGCGAPRDSATRYYTWLARPLWLLPGDDALAELLSRRVMSRVLAGSPQAYPSPWGGDLEELTLRYAWPVAWSRVQRITEESVVGHEPTPSYDVTPTQRALQRPAAAEEEDWEPRRRRARMRYAPRYVRREKAFGPVEHQLVLFKRGDSLLVAVAYDLGADSAWAQGDARVALVVAAGPGRELARAESDGASRVGVLMARMPREAGVASVEAWSPRASFAARSRYGVRPLAADAQVSSLAVLRAPPPTSAPLTEDVLLALLGTRTVRAGDAVHLYWESYAPSAGDSSQVSLSMQRVNVGLLERAASRIRLAPRARPVTMRWTEPGGGERRGRALALRIPEVPAGTYRVELAIGAADGAATAATTVRVLPRERR